MWILTQQDEANCSFTGYLEVALQQCWAWEPWDKSHSIFQNRHSNAWVLSMSRHGTGNNGAGDGTCFESATQMHEYFLWHDTALNIDFCSALDATKVSWIRHETMGPSKQKPWECTIHEGEMIYFPDWWHHATINLERYTVFVSSFTSEHNDI